MTKLVNTQCVITAIYIHLLKLPVYVPVNTVCITVDAGLRMRAWSTYNVEFCVDANEWRASQHPTDDEVSVLIGSIDVTQDDLQLWEESHLGFDSFIFDTHGQFFS